MSYTPEKYNKFNAIRRENNLKSVWSIYDIDDVFAPAETPPKLRYMTYGGALNYPLPPVPIPSNPTYFDLWLAAEALIRMEGGKYNRIAAFYYIPDGDTYDLSTTL
jgi:hypothetical protein